MFKNNIFQYVIYHMLHITSYIIKKKNNYYLLDDNYLLKLYFDSVKFNLYTLIYFSHFDFGIRIISKGREDSHKRGRKKK